MNTWIVTVWDGGWKDVEVTADKAIISDSGVLMFFDEYMSGNVLVRAFNEWHSCILEDEEEAGGGS